MKQLSVSLLESRLLPVWVQKDAMSFGEPGPLTSWLRVVGLLG